jgi:hypothetical protein
MKRKHAGAFVIVAVASLTLAALALEGHASKGPKVFLLRSQRRTIAELRIQAGTECVVMSSNPSGRMEYNQTTGTLSASRGVVLRISAGTNSVTVAADEVESVPEPK